jgi:BirA family biotin operon repressor/biotin-[acetyl-CoA-carboxylase] ligase
MTAFLDVAAIAGYLGANACRFDVDVLSSCASTNSLLLERAENGAPSGSVLVTETQTAGRGRRGRPWLSSPGDSLTFSLLWRFAPGTAPAGLSLAAGVAVARGLEKVGSGETAPAVQLKWPNDILLNGRKLGGILVELQPGVPHAAVIGIGINLRLPDGMPDDVRAMAIAWPTQADPNQLLANQLAAFLDTLQMFAAGGFASLRNDWTARHAFQDQPVRLLSDFASPREGLCRGADHDGALLFECDGRVERVLSGEVSLRSAA